MKSLKDASPPQTQQTILNILSQGFFLTGFNLFIISLALPLITKQWHIPSELIGLPAGMTLLGTVFGSIVFGKLTDKLGRKKMLIYNTLILTVFAALSAISWNLTSLCIFRLLLGLGIGADYPITASYLAEILPKDQRGKKICTVMMVNCLGIFAAITMSTLILHLFSSIDAWRLMLGSACLPGIFILIARVHLVESPRWLLANNQLDKAAEAMKKIIGDSIDYSTEVIHSPKQVKFIAIFQSKYLKYTVIIASCWFILDIAYYGVGLFIPIIITNMNLVFHASFIQQNLSVSKIILFLNAFIFLGAIFSIIFVEKLGRLNLQQIGFFGVFIGLLLFAMAPSSHSKLLLAFSGLIIFNFFGNFGPGAITYLLPAEIYETNLRASGHGFVTGCGKTGAILGVILIPIAQKHMGISFTLGLLALLSLFALALTRYLSLETGSLSMEEIQQKL